MENVELRIMPNGKEGRWYWEVIKDGREVVARGVTETEPTACEQANEQLCCWLRRIAAAMQHYRGA